MTEAEWLASTDPIAMLRRLSPWDNKDAWDARKLRLWCVACCWHVSPELGRDAEQCMEWESGPARDAANWAMAWAGDQKVPTAAERASLLRCVIGNPFRAVNVDPAWRTSTVLRLCESAYDNREGAVCGRCGESGIDPEERFDALVGSRLKCPTCHGTGRLGSGTLDAVTLAVLADALEEAGCEDEGLLMHMRGRETCPKCFGAGKYRLYPRDQFPGGDPVFGTCWDCKFTTDRRERPGGGIHLGCGFIDLRGPHVRGCAVLDAILGKS